MTIHTAVIEHMSGMDIHTSLTQEGLNKKVADYCRSHWSTISWRSDDPRPEEPADDEEAINIYFDDHENDSLTTEVSECESPLAPTADEILDALLRRDFILSLNDALKRAGGSLSWDRIKDQTMDELSVILGRNNIMLAYRDSNKASDYRNYAAAVANALPHLK